MAHDSSHDSFLAPGNQVTFASLPGDVTLMQARFTDHAFERHSHDCFTLGVTLDGTQSFRCKGRRHDSQPGELVLFNPEDDHDGNRGASSGFRYANWSVPRALVQDLADGAAPCYVTAPHVIDPALGARFMAVNAALLATPGETLRGETLVRDFLLTLFARHGESRLHAPAHSAGPASVARIKAYIDAHFASDITVADLAAVSGLSRAHLTRAFTAAFHTPPHSYLNTVRIRQAQAMIRAGVPLAEVALASGYVDQSHFARRFKGSVGTSPAQWRAACLS